MSFSAETLKRAALTSGALILGGVLSAAPAPAADSVIEEHRFPDRIVWETGFAHTGATFRLLGAEGEVLRREFAPGEPLVQALRGRTGADLPDGRYTYELRIGRLNAGPEVEGEPARVTGQVLIRRGVVQPGREVDETETLQSQSSKPPDFGPLGSLTERSGHCADNEFHLYQVGEEVCVGAYCTDCRYLRNGFPLRIEDLGVGIELRDISTADGAPTRDWLIQVNARSGSDEFFALVDCGDECESGKFDPDPVTSEVTPLFIEGGVHDDTIYLSYDNVGFGTVPSEDLHVYDAGPTLRLEDSDDGTYGTIRYNVGLLALEGNSGQNIVELSGKAPHQSIRVTASGRVGIGTGAPGEDLHILATQPTLVLQEEGDGTFARMRYGGGRLLLEGNSGQNIVSLDAAAPARAITVDADGDVALGAGVATTSSRTAKEAFEPVDRDALLEKIAALPVSTWIYKRDSDRARHLGPVAEDFHAAFGLGEDARHISLTDLAGVAVAGVQGLQGALAEAEEETANLRDANRELRARVGALEALADGLLQRLAALEQGAGAPE